MGTDLVSQNVVLEDVQHLSGQSAPGTLQIDDLWRVDRRDDSHLHPTSNSFFDRVEA